MTVTAPPPSAAKPRLLVVELWGLGDLLIATPFMRAAAEKFEVTVLAKPYALDLQARFWPGVNVIPVTAPWTAFKGKYRLHKWPWREIFRLLKTLRGQRFDFGVSAHRGGDPRDHLLLQLAGVKTRLGFPRMGSGIFLTQPLERAGPEAHHYRNWRILGSKLGLELPARDGISLPRVERRQDVLIHSGAGQPVRVWPLERYRNLAMRLREKSFSVQIACDPDQREWWLGTGEKVVVAPQTVTELLALMDRAGAFVGNDSGPGHLAAFCGVPTFTIFGPQLPKWFAPLHPASQWVEGKPCPYKPCSDYCRFSEPLCINGLTEDEIFNQVEQFLRKTIA